VWTGFALDIVQFLRQPLVYPSPVPVPADRLQPGRLARTSRWARVTTTGVCTGPHSANAIDSLAAIRPEYLPRRAADRRAELIDAVDQDFAGCKALLHRLRYDSPMFGDGNEMSETLAVWLLAGSRPVKDLHNERGGRSAPNRPAMYYLWHVRDLPASPDGRRKGEPLGRQLHAEPDCPRAGPAVSNIKTSTRPGP
jgi:formate C-acetyltransferase